MDPHRRGARPARQERRLGVSDEVSVEALDDADRGAWRDYVRARPGAALFHDLRWSDCVAAAYGLRNLHLVAKKGGVIAGVLPLTLAASPLFGRSLISAAFAVGGGVLADDVAVAAALGAAALELGRSLDVKYVELRGGAAPGDGYEARSDAYATFSKELPAEADEILNSLPRNRRAEVRKALRIDDDAEKAFRLSDGVDEFYNVYAVALRNLGTPVMPKSFLEALKFSFGDEVEISLIEHRGRPVAGLLSFWRGDRVAPYYIGAGEMARDIRAYDYLYYSLMRRAVARGARIFDFGRSKLGSTHFATKTYWGFEPSPVVHYIALVGAKETPNINPNNPKFAAFIGAWRRLPLPLANFIGPFVARNFP